jgi:uncharacterized protein (TIGR02099 family)
MKIVVRRISLGLSWITIFSVILLAVLLSIGRIFSPAVQDYLPRIQATASELLKQPVIIDSIDISWDGLFPAVGLHGFRVLDQDGEADVLGFKHIFVHPDFSAMVFKQQLKPSAIVLVEADMPVVLGQDERLTIPGLTLLEQQSEDNSTDVRKVLDGLSGIHFSLRNSKIRWENQLSNNTFAFGPVDANLEIEGTQFEGAADIGLPASLGKRLILKAQLEGEPWITGGWRADIYAKAEALQFESLSEQTLLRFAGMKKGGGDIEGWLTMGEQGFESMVGNFDLQGLTWAHARDDRDYQLGQARAKFRLARHEQGIALDLDNFVVERAGYSWPVSSMSVRLDRSDTHRRVTLDAGFMNIGELSGFLKSRKEISAQHHEWLERLSPEGVLKELSLNLLLNGDTLETISVEGEFQNLGWKPWEDLPGIEGLDGRLSMTDRDGELYMDSQDIALNYPTMFNDVLDITELNGNLSWQEDRGRYQLIGSDISLANDDIHGTGRFEMGLGREPSDLKLQFAFADGNGNKVARYLPVGILRPKTYQWLFSSLQGGYVPEVQVIFSGKLGDFPFRNGEGIFITRFSATDVTLDYREGWPRLEKLSGDVEFRNASMSILANGGQIFNSTVQEGEVRIDDLFAASLKIQAIAKGPLEDVFRYLRESPLGKGKELVLDDLATKGNSTLGLSLEIPLSAKLDKELTVSGLLDFEGCALGLKRRNIDFTDVAGQLAFTDRSVNIADATVLLDGQPLRVSADTKSSGRITVRMAGMLRPGTVLRHLDDDMRGHFSGVSSWQGRLEIPPLKASRGKIPVLYLLSDLQGTKSTYPAPLNKTAASSWPIEVKIPLGGRGLSLDIDLEERANARLMLSGKQFVLKRAGIHLGPGDAVLPEQGIELTGVIDKLDANAWQEIFTSKSDSENDLLASGFRRMNLKIGTLYFQDRTLHEIKANAVRNKEGWSILMQSPWISGTVQTAGIDRPVRLNLEYLNLDHDDLRSQQPTEVSPGSLPSLSMQSGQITLAGRILKNVNLSTRQRDGRMRIHALSFETEGFDARLKGEWVKRKKGQETDINYNFQIRDLGKFSEFFEWDAGLVGGEGKIAGTAKWNASPMEFSWKNDLRARLELELEKGVVSGVDAGAGKILGLFNLDALGRRVRLDFHDLPEEGFGYNNWTGTVRAKGAEVSSQNMKLTSSSADLKLNGLTKLDSQEMDIRLDVVPKLYSSVPIAGAILAGPAAGAALYVLGKIPAVSKAMEKGATLEYELKGSWDNPSVERINIPEPDEEQEGELFG